MGERGQGPRQVGQDLGESRREGDVRRVEQGVQRHHREERGVGQLGGGLQRQVILS